MKCLIVFSVLLALAAAELYTTENDDLDIEGVVGNEETFTAFNNCFLDKGSCNAQSSDFKKDMPEAIKEACGKCTPAQKHIFRRYLEVIKVQKPAEYEALKQKYDPENKYFSALETAIANA